MQKLRILTLSLVGIFVLFVIVALLASGPIIRRKLQETIVARLDASLTIGSLTYRPPFTVHLYDVRFLARPDQPGGGTELISAQQVDLSLARSPFHPGPLVIERFKVAGLTVHAIRKADGKYLGLDLAKPGLASPSSAAMKLSHVLRLRQFILKDGTIIYQDQAHPDSAPVRWQGISSEVALAPKSASLYTFQLNAADEPIARATVDGTIDVDSLLLQINKLTASVQAAGAQPLSGPDPLPAELRELIRRYCVKGTIALSIAGTIPLLDPAQTLLTADLGIEGGGAILPGRGEKLDDLSLSTHIQRDASRTTHQQIEIQLRQFRAVSGGAILKLSSAVSLFDPHTGKWSINGASGSLDALAENHGPWDLTGHVDFHADIAHDPLSNQTSLAGGVNLIGIDLRPPGLDVPLEGLTGTIQISGNDAGNRQIILRNFVARYGGDTLVLDHADLVLRQFPDRIGISDIQSRLDLAQDAPPFPGDLGPILQSIHPSGRFTITGAAAMQRVMRDDGPGYSPEWDLKVSTENGNLALLDERLPVTGLKGQMLVTTHAISIPALQGNLLGGSMDLTGTARVVDPITYEGEFKLHGASFQQFAQVFKITTPDGSEPTGVGDLDFKFFSEKFVPGIATSATQPDSDYDEWLGTLGGDGRLQIDDGDLWALPVLQSLSKHTRIARRALTAGEAAAIFRVANRAIDFKHLAVYSPALGLQGSGSETFDGTLDLDIIAAPLGDWKRKLSETPIPLLSPILGSVAGSIEKLVGNATSELLYHFKVTGTRDNPQVETIPAPLITQPVANLFAKMLHRDNNAKLIDSVGEK